MGAALAGLLIVVEYTIHLEFIILEVPVISTVGPYSFGFMCFGNTKYANNASN